MKLSLHPIKTLKHSLSKNKVQQVFPRILATHVAAKLTSGTVCCGRAQLVPLTREHYGEMARESIVGALPLQDKSRELVHHGHNVKLMSEIKERKKNRQWWARREWNIIRQLHVKTHPHKQTNKQTNTHTRARLPWELCWRHSRKGQSARCWILRDL